MFLRRSGIRVCRQVRLFSSDSGSAKSARLAGLPQDQVGGYSSQYANSFENIFGN